MQLVKTLLLLCTLGVSTYANVQSSNKMLLHSEVLESMLEQNTKDPPLFEALMIFTGKLILLFQVPGEHLLSKCHHLLGL